MEKKIMLAIRVDPSIKSRLERAAVNTGKSLTAFIVDAATKAAERAEAKPALDPTKTLRGVPTFFRACCTTAAAGGGQDYSGAGHELARHLGSLAPDGYSLAEWADEVESFAAMIAAGDSEAAIDWLQSHYPKCMELVPVRRREKFLEGVAVYAEEHGLEV